MEILLRHIAETEALGGRLASLLPGSGVTAVLFKGGLGAGKTTLIRALATALPGGELAEAASPSFNLCNLYPTIPPLAHYDLYRQEEGMADESLLDFLEDGRHVVLIEWAERLPGFALPPERLECELGKGVPEGTRRATFTAYGTKAEALLDALRAHHAIPPLVP